MSTDNNIGDDAVERILNAIASVNITLARVEARIDNLIRDTKDHEGRIRVLEHDQADAKLLRAQVAVNAAAIEKAEDELSTLESDRDAVRGFMRAVAIITPAVSGIITAGIMLLVKTYGG